MATYITEIRLNEGVELVDPRLQSANNSRIISGSAGALSWLSIGLGFEAAVGGIGQQNILTALFFFTFAITAELRREPSFAISSIQKAVCRVLYTAVLGLLFVPIWYHVLPHFHALPKILTHLTTFILRLFGIQGVIDGASNAVIVEEGTCYRFSVTAEKILPTGCLIILIASLDAITRGGELHYRIKRLPMLLISVLAYIPARLCIVAVIGRELDWLGAFWNPFLGFLSYLPLVLIMQRIVEAGERSFPRGEKKISQRGGRIISPAYLLLIAVATLSIFLNPSGLPKEGRVVLDDSHANWEWSDVPMSQKKFTQETSYNYSCFRQFLSNYYDVHINRRSPINAELLECTSVLILKTPTIPYTPEEVSAILTFLENGGGVFLIGDHTNLFGMANNLNQIAHKVELDFQSDDTFDLVTGQQTFFSPHFVLAHPIARLIRKLQFETSCTIRCRLGSEIIVGRNMGCELVDYGHVNFFGDIKAQPNEAWGSFIQLASAEYGKGRILGFSDSTIWSSFSMFMDDKPTLALACIEWLNRRQVSFWTHQVRSAILILCAICAVLVYIFNLFLGSSPPRLVNIICYAIFVWLIAGGASWASSSSFQLPSRKDNSNRVAIIHTDKCHFELPSSIQPLDRLRDSNCFDAFFLNIQRSHIEPYLDRVPGLQQEPDMRVVINPETLFFQRDWELVVDYVRKGGNVLLLSKITDSDEHFLLKRLGLEGAVERKMVANCICNETTHFHYFYRGPEFTFSFGEDISGQLISKQLGIGRVIWFTNPDLMSARFMGGAYQPATESQKQLYNFEFSLLEWAFAKKETNTKRLRRALERFRQSFERFS